MNYHKMFDEEAAKDEVKHVDFKNSKKSINFFALLIHNIAYVFRSL